MPKFVNDIVLESSNINLSKGALKAAAIESLASDPASPVAGQIYFNSTDGRLKIYDGTTWRYASGAFTNTDISASANIALSKLATDPLARANHTGTQTASTISNFETTVKSYPINTLGAASAALDLNGQKITSLGTPTADTDAATKAYVDGVRLGLDFKESVRAVSTSNITLSGTQTIDGVSLVAGDRVLVAGQSTGANNGIYVVAAGAWTRATDFDASTEATAGVFTFVTEGTSYGDSGWVLATNDPVVLGTTSLTFVQFSGAGQITAGAGLTKSGNTLDVVGTSNRITVNADSIDIASTYVGQNTITTLGTITTGTWNGTTIAIANGGTGATTASAARLNLGASADLSTASLPQKLAFSIGDGAATSYTVTHNMNTRDVHVMVSENGSPYAVVYPDIEIATVNSVTIKFSVAPTTNKYRVVVVG